MPNDSDVTRFLQAIFPDFSSRAIFVCNFAAGGMTNIRDIEKLDPARDCYLSSGAYPNDGNVKRKNRVQEVRTLVIDDVGTAGADIFTGEVISKVTPEAARRLGAATAVIRTSPDNYHYWFKLSRPVLPGEWRRFRAAVDAMLGTVPDGAPAGHIFRLPMGTNTKRGCRVELVSVDENAGALDVDAILTAHAGNTQPASPKLSKKVESSQRVHDIRGLVKLWPNNVEYDEWINTGERIVALALDREAGREAFHEWSARATLKIYREDYTETKWRSLTADSTRGQKLLDDIWAHDRCGFDAWWQNEAGPVFDDGTDHPEELPGPGPKSGITATPYQWVDLDKTQPRDWLYGDILLRRFITMTVAPGGVGKSSLVAVETLAQVTGKNLLGEDPAGELRVWLWNLEDPYAETQLRIQAAAKHYRLTKKDIGDRLFVDSGRDQRLVVAVMERNGPVIVRPVVKDLVEQIRLKKIDVVVVDPFVSCHQLPENDNTAQDMIVKEWGRVAELGGCAVHLVDHTSKAGSKEVVTDSSRGAKAKTDAARVVRVVNRMSENDGRMYGITETWRYFNTFNDKANMAPPKARRAWFRMESIWAGNGGSAAAVFSVGAAAVLVRGDSVGVAVSWKPPNAQDMANGDSYTRVAAVMGKKRWRTAPRSPDWVGLAIAQALQIDAPSISGRASIKTIIKKWILEGLFKVSEQMDDRRRLKEYIELAGVY